MPTRIMYDVMTAILGSGVFFSTGPFSAGLRPGRIHILGQFHKFRYLGRLGTWTFPQRVGRGSLSRIPDPDNLHEDLMIVLLHPLNLG